MDTILLATDGSDSAADAYEVALELARDTGAALAVLSVDDSLWTDAAMMASADRIAAHARKAGIEASPIHRYGKASTEIVAAARDIGADLIVLGCRGRGALADAVLGTTSADVVAHADRPVTVVRAFAAVRDDELTHATA